MILQRMSECAQCNGPIAEGEKISEVPCCDLKYHSSCAITRFCSALYYSSSLFCPCGAVLHQHANSYSEDDLDVATRVSEVMAKEGVPAEVKAIKKKKTAARKALAAYKRMLAVKKREFNDLVANNVETLKTAKKNAVNEVKASPEYKDYRRYVSAANTAEGAFLKKHAMHRYVAYTIFGERSWYKRMRMPLRYIRYAFRIRL
jgi:hypothetical protein